MPSYAIHIAVAVCYLEGAVHENQKEFIRGVIAPDLLKKPESHFGPASSDPDTRRYAEECGLDTSYNRGYYLHLLTDKLFYGEYLTRFSPEIYKDYDKLNSRIIERYGIKLPEQIRDVVSYEKGDPVILDETVFDFIEVAADMGLCDNYKPGELCFRMGKRLADDSWFIRATQKGYDLK